MYFVPWNHRFSDDWYWGLHVMQYDRATEGSSRKLHAGLELANTQAYRKYLNSKVLAIGMSLFGDEKGPWELAAVRFVGQVLVDDWTCLRTMVSLHFIQVNQDVP